MDEFLRVQRLVQVFVQAGVDNQALHRCLKSLSDSLPACTVFVRTNKPEATFAPFHSLDLKLIPDEIATGFAQACNLVIENCLKDGSDLLLLRPSVEVTAESLDEMRAILACSERHAVVTPRTNGGGPFSFPRNERLPAAESRELWFAMAAQLPRYQIVPAAGGFCTLIKGGALDWFGNFDTSYWSSSACLADFLCRINRSGYSSLVANRAFVFQGEGNLEVGNDNGTVSNDQFELTRRYEEFDSRISNYEQLQVDPLEIFAILKTAKRQRILYDLSHLEPSHSGTSELGISLLRELEPLASREFEFYVGAGKKQSFFQPELRGYRLYDHILDPPRVFALVYRPCQLLLGGILQPLPERARGSDSRCSILSLSGVNT